MCFHKRWFKSGEFWQDYVYSADETHFLANLHDICILSMKNDKNLKYTNVFRGDQGVAKMVLISCGSNAHLQLAMVTFQIDICFNSTQRISENISGLCYCSEPKIGLLHVFFRYGLVNSGS